VPSDLDEPIVSVETLKREVDDAVGAIVDAKRKRFTNTSRPKDGSHVSDYPKESQNIYQSARRQFDFFLAYQCAYPSDIAANAEAQQCLRDAARQAEIDAGGTLGMF
jgi:hypothetical protein